MKSVDIAKEDTDTHSTVTHACLTLTRYTSHAFVPSNKNKICPHSKDLEIFLLTSAAL